MNVRIPFLNLKAQHDALRDELASALQEVIDSSAFAGGPFVERFEEDFAAYCQCDGAVGVGSGTEALWLVLLALGVGPGDEVITVPNTFIATAEAITFCGATPVFVDVDEHTYTMDPSLLDGAITPRTKAIIPVHLFGQTADMDPILHIARNRGLPVIEDACQAHGAEYKGRKAGTLGEAGCFSFYPGKNLGALGEAGAVVTNSLSLRQTLRTLRDHGQVKKYHHALVGWNARMDGLQAAALRVKLKHLPKFNEARRAHAQLYGKHFRGMNGIVTPQEAAYALHVYHLYVVRVKEREALLGHLAEKGIVGAVHYPVPLHLQPAYRSLGLGQGSFPVAEQGAAEFLSLPMFPELTPEQIGTVAREVVSGLRARSKEYAPAV